MKKGLSFFILTALVITTWLWFVRDQFTSINANGEKEVIHSVEENINLNEFLSLYNEGSFEKIELNDAVKLAWYKINTWTWAKDTNALGIAIDKNYVKYMTNKPPEMSLQDLWIIATGATLVDITYNESSLFARLFLEQILPLIFFIFLLVLAIRFFGPKWWWAFPFGSKVGILRTGTDVSTKFKDVAGMDEVKQELIEIVDFLKNPKKYQDVWAKIPKWVLLYWPPGSGKTLLARAVAGEAGVPFFSTAWSEFMEMLVGMWASKVRDLFKKAKAANPAIIFIDEIDSIGKKRWGWFTWGHQEQEQTLNQILTEMDGFDKDTNIIVIAATNRPDTLDSALMRSWRFDRKVMVGRPTLEERQLILSLHLKDKKVLEWVNLESLARRTSGFVWADLANLINEAALKVAKENRTELTEDDFEYALEKIIMWPEKKIKSLKEKERHIVTYHELGHAVTAYDLPNADPVEKISIVSRGMALWVTWMMPEEDRYLYSKAKFLDEMVTLLWWRAAEEIFFGKDEITTGASNDFEKVTKIAYDMIMKYGMDEELWTLIYYDRDKWDYVPFKPFSETTSEIIDTKVKSLVHTAYTKALEILTKYKELIEKMAALLLEKEYIDREEFKAMMKDPNKIDDLTTEFRKNHKLRVQKQEETRKKVEEEQKQLLQQEDTPNAQKKDMKKTIDTFLSGRKKKQQ